MSSTIPDNSVPPPEDQLRAVVDEMNATPSVADLVVDVSPGAQSAPRGWAFDPRQKGFIMSTNGRGVMPTYRMETMKTWIVKTIYTAKGVHPIYSDDYGMDNPFEAIGGPMNASAIGEYEVKLREALIYHPRISDVTDYAAAPTPMGDGYTIAFTVVLDDGNSVSISNMQVPS